MCCETLTTAGHVLCSKMLCCVLIRFTYAYRLLWVQRSSGVLLGVFHSHDLSDSLCISNITSRNLILITGEVHYVVLCYVGLRQCCVMLLSIVMFCVLHCVDKCCVARCGIVLRSVVLCCCAVMECVVLSCAALSCVSLSCVVLWYSPENVATEFSSLTFKQTEKC